MLKCRQCDYTTATLRNLRTHFITVHHTDVNADMVRRQAEASDDQLQSAGLAAGFVALLGDPLHEPSRAALRAAWKGQPLLQEEAGGEFGGAGATVEVEPPEPAREVESQSEPAREVESQPEPVTAPPEQVPDSSTSSSYESSSSSSFESSSSSDSSPASGASE